MSNSVRKIKFFITPVYPYGNDHYYHEMIALAEGFKELGYAVIGNTDYWFVPEENKFLIPYDESGDFDIAIYDYRYVTSFAHLLFRKGFPNFDRNKKHVLIDRNDWISPIWANNKNYEVFDLIFVGNLFSNVKYSANIRPWAIGLTNRIMHAIDRSYAEGQKKDLVIGHNFRVPHNMRERVLKGLENSIKTLDIKACFTNDVTKEEWTEADKIYSKTSVNRHFPEYFKLINHVSLFMSFGGYYEYKPVVYQPYTFFSRLRRKPYYFLAKFLKMIGKEDTPALFIFQSDNFRFWEILYSGSCPININFESWNIRLPEYPVDGKHYLGIKKFDFAEFSSRVSALSKSEVEGIAAAGRNWVAEHYSPKAQAQRVLSHLSTT